MESFGSLGCTVLGTHGDFYIGDWSICYGFLATSVSLESHLHSQGRGTAQAAGSSAKPHHCLVAASRGRGTRGSHSVLRQKGCSVNCQVDSLNNP